MLTKDKRQAIRERAEAATPGPWSWHANTSGHSCFLLSLVELRPIVMAFERWGTQQALPAFRNFSRDVTERADRWFVRPESHNPWRVTDIDHPDAAFIAHARTDVPALLAHTEELEALLRRAVQAHNVRGSDGPCDCDQCRDIAAAIGAP